jgi:polar amino acid transport system permease protein
MESIRTIFDIFITTYPGFLDAVIITLQLTAISVVLGTILGIAFALMKISKSKILQGIANLYITVIRGTPLLVQIMFLYFGITQIVVLDNFWAGALAL